MRAGIERLSVPEGRRILAVSDIHASTGLFCRLLDEVGFCETDELFICGDIIEKGGGSLDALRYFMELSKKKNVHILMGNCDSLWMDVEDEDPENDAQILHYMLCRGCGILVDMCARLGIEVHKGMDMPAAKRAIRENFRTELGWLASLPHIIDTPQITFVHAGLNSENLESHSDWDVMKNDAFMEKGITFSKWVVCGHWPVDNYCRETGCVNPIVNREQKIISIDGGNHVRLGGQLNCLVLPDIRSEEFSFQSVDDFEEAVVLQKQAASPEPLYVVWTENTVEVLEEGEELCLCRQLSTGRKLIIAADQLFQNRDGTIRCGTGTDYMLPLEPGERVRVVRRYRSRILCKKEGVLGWAPDFLLGPVE